MFVHTYWICLRNYCLQWKKKTPIWGVWGRRKSDATGPKLLRITSVELYISPQIVNITWRIIAMMQQRWYESWATRLWRGQSLLPVHFMELLPPIKRSCTLGKVFPHPRHTQHDPEKPNGQLGLIPPAPVPYSNIIAYIQRYSTLTPELIIGTMHLWSTFVIVIVAFTFFTH